MQTELIRFNTVNAVNVGRWEIYKGCYFYSTVKPSKWNIFWHSFFLGWKWEDV